MIPICGLWPQMRKVETGCGFVCIAYLGYHNISEMFLNLLMNLGFIWAVQVLKPVFSTHKPQTHNYPQPALPRFQYEFIWNDPQGRVWCIGVRSRETWVGDGQIQAELRAHIEIVRRPWRTPGHARSMECSQERVSMCQVSEALPVGGPQDNLQAGVHLPHTLSRLPSAQFVLQVPMHMFYLINRPAHQTTRNNIHTTNQNIGLCNFVFEKP